MKVACRH